MHQKNHQKKEVRPILSQKVPPLPPSFRNHPPFPSFRPPFTPFSFLPSSLSPSSTHSTFLSPQYNITNTFFILTHHSTGGLNPLALIILLIAIAAGVYFTQKK